jgi:dihydropteroate synthase
MIAAMRRRFTWVLPRTTIELGKRTAVMGILNVTPDSFSDGGMYLTRDKAVDRALEMEQEGADLLDIGGESSRPGSTPVAQGEELERVLPVLEALASKLRIPISIDTYRSEVGKRALEAGAQIVNDISAFRFDPHMAAVVRDHRAGVVLMHSRGSRQDLHTQQPMSNAVEETIAGLRQAAQAAVQAGIASEAIVVDPGIGFGKRAEESLAVLRHIPAVSSQLEYPLLLGTSRKSFLAKVIQDKSGARLWGTAATVASVVLQGAHAIRVHDVAEMRMLVDVLDAVSAEN